MNIASTTQTLQAQSEKKINLGKKKLLASIATKQRVPKFTHQGKFLMNIASASQTLQAKSKKNFYPK